MKRQSASHCFYFAASRARCWVDDLLSKPLLLSRRIPFASTFCCPFWLDIHPYNGIAELLSLGKYCIEIISSSSRRDEVFWKWLKREIAESCRRNRNLLQAGRSILFSLCLQTRKVIKIIWELEEEKSGNIKVQVFRNLIAVIPAGCTSPMEATPVSRSDHGANRNSLMLIDPWINTSVLKRGWEKMVDNLTL